MRVFFGRSTAGDSDWIRSFNETAWIDQLGVVGTGLENEEWDLVAARSVVGAVQETIMRRIAIIDQLRDTGILPTPLVPHRTIVQKMRLTWFGTAATGKWHLPGKPTKN